MLNFLLFTFISQQLVQGKWTCPASWTVNTDRCYKQKTSWPTCGWLSTQRNACGAPQWLGQFTTAAELQFLHTFSQSMSCSDYWLDISKIGGQWTTASGTTLTNSFMLTFWKGGQPQSDTCLAFDRTATWPNILFTTTCTGTLSGPFRGAICAQNATWIPPTASPTTTPSKMPTTPTKTPTTFPSAKPTHTPSRSPSNPPSISPTFSPTKNPSASPSGRPSHSPTRFPSDTPTKNPTAFPTETGTPTQTPTRNPSTSQPTNNPSIHPSVMPTNHPSVTPTAEPTSSPSTSAPISTTQVPRVIAVTQIAAGQSSGGSAGFSLQTIQSNSLYIFVLVIGVVVICICCVIGFGFCFIHQRKKSLDHLRKEVMMSAQNRGRVTSNSGMGSSSYSVPMEMTGRREQKQILRVNSSVEVGSNKSDTESRDSSPEVVNIQSQWEVEGPKPPPVPSVTYKQ